MVRASGPKDLQSEAEPELPGAGAGATTLVPAAVLGVPAVALGDTAVGERAATKNIKKFKKIKNLIYLVKLVELHCNTIHLTLLNS